MLFNDTILANVAFGRPGASFAEVTAAAAAAQLDAAIARMPAGGWLAGVCGVVGRQAAPPGPACDDSRLPDSCCFPPSPMQAGTHWWASAG